MKHVLLVGFLLLVLSGVVQSTQAQVGLGTTTADASAALCISALNKGGLFPPVGSTALAAAVAVPSLPAGPRVYITNAAVDGGAGFCYDAGTTAASCGIKLTSGATPSGGG